MTENRLLTRFSSTTKHYPYKVLASNTLFKATKVTHQNTNRWKYHRVDIGVRIYLSNAMELEE